MLNKSKILTIEHSAVLNTEKISGVLHSLYYYHKSLLYALYTSLCKVVREGNNEAAADYFAITQMR